MLTASGQLSHTPVVLHSVISGFNFSASLSINVGSTLTMHPQAQPSILQLVHASPITTKKDSCHALAATLAATNARITTLLAAALAQRVSHSQAEFVRLMALPFKSTAGLTTTLLDPMNLQTLALPLVLGVRPAIFSRLIAETTQSGIFGAVPLEHATKVHLHIA